MEWSPTLLGQALFTRVKTAINILARFLRLLFLTVTRASHLHRLLTLVIAFVSALVRLLFSPLKSLI